MVLLLAFNLIFSTLLASAPVWAENFAAPASLKTIPVPEPNNLGLFLKSDPNNLNPDGLPIATAEAKLAAIRLGKALFWDMQLGSDGVQACASCHFHAGADNRAKNQINPGLPGGDSTFSLMGPNGILTLTHFPTTKFLNTNDRFSQMLFDTNDVISSQGVFKTAYIGQPLKAGSAVEQGTIAADTVFNVGGNNVRRVAGRNAPTAINAIFNYANFWDGRANFIFNGQNPFGDADPNAGVWVNNNGNLEKVRARIPNGSLASQAVGPPGSDFEMSFAGRTFPEIGKKLLGLTPLGKQKVHPEDSALGPLAKSPGKGLNTTYTALIQAAFQDKYWNSADVLSFDAPRVVTYLERRQVLDAGKATIIKNKDAALLAPGQYSQMEANFSLFFGLAVQLYEATLVSDDSPFDRFQEGDFTAMSPSAQSGLNIFLAANEPLQIGGGCIGCHSTETFSNASVMHVGATNFGASLPEGLMERMIMGDFGGAWYDSGYYDIGVRPIETDIGRGGGDPFGNPLSFTERALLVYNGQGGQLSFDSNLVNPLPCGPGFQLVCPQDQRAATRGSFKVPTLRNVELTGPYMHNGGQATLMQVVDFYSRGGDFHERNISTLDPELNVLFGLNGNEPAQRQLIDFLLALTDERVRWEKAPFDHPELLIPNGAAGNTQKVQAKNGQAKDNKFVRLPAVGAAGLKTPIGAFLNLDPHDPVW